MSPTPSKKATEPKPGLVTSEEIERLREQVARAEAKGLYDTAHHEMLRRALGQPVSPAPADEEE